MNLQPLNDRILIEPVEEEAKTTKSGIFIADSKENQMPIKGRVVATGPGKLDDRGNRVPMFVKVGDLVLFKKYGPDELEVDGKKYLVAEEADILAIIN